MGSTTDRTISGSTRESCSGSAKGKLLPSVREGAREGVDCQRPSAQSEEPQDGQGRRSALTQTAIRHAVDSSLEHFLFVLAPMPKWTFPIQY
jgi:hypothetical protein